MSAPLHTKFLLTVDVADPDTGEIVPVEIHKDPQTGYLFGVVAEMQWGRRTTSPYTGGEVQLERLPSMRRR
jgi:hypothetical protein